jgi:hypothetical protein
MITVTGCLLRDGDNSDRYVLAQPTRGRVDSVSEESCTASPGATALELEDTSDVGMNDSMLGRWIEITGRLERETSDNPDNLRELEVRSFRIVPVARPAAAVLDEPAPLAVAPPVETPAPVATTGQAAPSLPQTASYLPATGVIGILLLAGALVARSIRSLDRY